MEVSRYRTRIKAIAFWTILAWIALITVLVLALIWDLTSPPLVQRFIWSATTLTGGILLCCVTILGFAAGEEDARRRLEGDVASHTDREHHLNDALARAKETRQD